MPRSHRLTGTASALRSEGIQKTSLQRKINTDLKRSNHPKESLMKTFVVLICSLALACVAGAQPPTEKKEQGKKKGAPAGQVSQPTGKATGKPAQVGKPPGAGKPTTMGKPMEVGKPTAVGKAKGGGQPTQVNKPAEYGKAKGKGQVANANKPAE